MLKRTTLPFLFIFLFAKSFAQSTADTILVYDILTQQIDTILPIAFNSATQADGSGSFIGSPGNQIPLSLTPPTSNLFSGSNFSKLARANSFFNLWDYPIRTVVALRRYTNGIGAKACSGMIVSSNFVMTLAYCVFSPFSKTFSPSDSLKVFPAFDNGAPQPNLPVSIVKKIYIFKTFYNNSSNDVALLELKYPIGLQTGWTGIGFDASPNFILNNVFHKFSYPSDTSIANSNLVYNGDTLYYNYGKIDENGSSYYYINSSEAVAVQGQGGSTFMYTDNNNQYLNVGISDFSANYLHYKITNAAFYQLQNVMQNNFATAVKENKVGEINLRLYPNPFKEQAVLEFDYNAGDDYTLSIANNLGQMVRSYESLSSGRTVIRKNALDAGVYILQLKNNKGLIYTCKMVVE